MAPPMSLEQALRLLGLLPAAEAAEEAPTALTAPAVKAAFRRLASTAHPDRGGDETAWCHLYQAYQVALRHALQPQLCPECGGAGKVARGTGFRVARLRCPTCQGTGVVLAPLP